MSKRLSHKIVPIPRFLSQHPFASHLGNDATKLTKRIGNAKEKNDFLHLNIQKSLSVSEITERQSL